LKKKHILHFLLFLFFFIAFKVTAFSNEIFWLFEVIGEIQFFIYIIAVFIVLKKYKTVYQENYADAKHIIYKWLFQITVFSCIAHTFVLVRWYLSNSAYEDYVINANIIISLSVLFITTFFVLKALYQPALFTGVDINLTPSKSLLKANISQKKLIKELSENEDIKRLIVFMEEEKPYLDDELTLQKLATQMEMPERELSILINQYLGKHFFDFINEYRINEAKKLLKSSTRKELTVQQVLYRVGFNSKSSFYTAFKKVTNQTPSAFRKSSN
jgi:AraC-like DNA-binding protein